MLQSLIIQMLVLYGQSMVSWYNLRYVPQQLAIAKAFVNPKCIFSLGNIFAKVIALKQIIFISIKLF